MTVQYAYYTGRPAEVLANLKRSLSQFANTHRAFKVGITADPDSRWGQHQESAPGWRRMLVVYRTTSYDFVCEVERALIAHSQWRDESWNEVAGGGGRQAEAAAYFVYFLLLP